MQQPSDAAQPAHAALQDQHAGPKPSGEPEPLRVVILGAGFAGLAAAKILAGRRGCEVTVLDRKNHHLFQPLLYQVATASLSPADIAQPVRSVLSGRKNTRVLLGEAAGIDPVARVVHLSDGKVGYDVLLVCTGVTHSYFNNPQWARLAPGLKTIDDALEIRRRFLLAFEAAEREADPAARRARLTFVVVGGGPTGVEMAGAMSEVARKAMPKDFRAIDTLTTRIVLVQSDPRLLAQMPEALSARAKRDLEELGVEVRLNARVTAVDEGGVFIGEERIDAANVFWAAGVAAGPLAAGLGAPLDRGGRVNVNPDLTVPGHPEILVLGDLAQITMPGAAHPVPGVAPAATQMGRYAGRLVKARLKAGWRPGRPVPEAKPFRYVDKGTLATIGRARAVADIRGLHVAGLPAWMLWAGVHVFFLIGFRNRLVVMLQWLWEYVVFSRGARLITGPSVLGLKRASEEAPAG